MAFRTPFTSNSLSGFTDPLSHFPNGNYSNSRPGPHRRLQGGIARPQRTARNGRTQAPSTTNIRSALLEGSTPEPKDQSHFDPKLGPIGSGRPKPRSASEQALKKAIRDGMYPWGDMSHLRPEDPGMDIATCVELYGLSTGFGEQEPPVTTTADSSGSDASAREKVHSSLGDLVVFPPEQEAETPDGERSTEKEGPPHSAD